MPRNRGRRREANGDWEAGRTEESYMNSSDGNSSGNRAGAGRRGENGDDIHNDCMNSNLSGGRHRQNRGSGSSQQRPKHSLDQWTEAVSKTARSIGAAYQAIKDLQGRFESHVDLKMIEETKEILRQLKEEYSRKDKEIQRHEDTITTLSSMNRKTEEMIKHQKGENEQERQELGEEKAKLEKRVTTAMAEERLKLRNKFDKLVIEHGQRYNKRKKELEDEFGAQREEQAWR